MGFIKRMYFEPVQAIGPVTADGKMTDRTVTDLFRKLNEVEEIKELHGFYKADELHKFSRKTFGSRDAENEIRDIDSRASGKFNAYTKIYAITSKQMFSGPLPAKYGNDVTKWPEEVVLKCAEENCKRLVDVINDFLRTSTDQYYGELYHKLEATLMNNSFKLFKYPDVGARYTDAIIKIAYKQ